MRLGGTVSYTAAVAASLARSSPAHAADPSTVEWSDDWPRVKWWEVVAARSLTVADTEFEDVAPLPSLMHFGFGSGRPLGEIQSGSLDAIPTLLPVRGGTELGMSGIF